MSREWKRGCEKCLAEYEKIMANADLDDSVQFTAFNDGLIGIVGCKRHRREFLDYLEKRHNLEKGIYGGESKKVLRSERRRIKRAIDNVLKGSEFRKARFSGFKIQPKKGRKRKGELK